MQYIVSFHVEEESLEAAQRWMEALKSIMNQNSEFLVSPSTGNGKWCDGHAEILQGAAPQSSGPQLVARK